LKNNHKAYIYNSFWIRWK